MVLVIDRREKLMIKELMNNAYAWLFLAFCTIAGCLISMYGLTNKRKKKLCIKNTYSVIQKVKYNT